MEHLRSSTRFPIKLPLAVQGEARQVSAETKDISSGGVLFHMDEHIEVGSVISFRISMPAHVLGTPEDVIIQCQGRVVRSVEENGRRAVAAVIDEYRFERQAGA